MHANNNSTIVISKNPDGSTQPRPLKRMIIQSSGARKKMKAHKAVPKYTITEDDAELVVEKVHDRVE
jgi:NACalpha-BTF3-like transcription factor